MPDASAIASVGYGPLVMLLAMIAFSVWLGTQAQKAVERGGFMQGYFLGNRGLGAWAVALTATVQSGGTFMGFPSLVYTHGWIVALWIGSYMVVPITGFAVLGKRFAQLSRRTGAITVPDLFDARYGDQRVGLVASLAILGFLTFLMIAQFKAGALVMKLTWPSADSLALVETAAEGAIASAYDSRYLIGLTIFAITVVGYTLIGGFLASVWTDMFQSVLMLLGVVLLFVLIVPHVSQQGMSHPTLAAIEHTSEDYAFGPGFSPTGLAFLPLGAAISFFFTWPIGGVGTPAGMVRLMACKDTDTIRRSIVLLSFYNGLIYLPLIVICICGRALMPGGFPPDEIVPRLAIWAAPDVPGGSLVSGLILAAPFGAVMATVSTFLVVIASGVVRDIYQRFVRPHADAGEIRVVTYIVMILLGVLGVLANINPVQFLQKLVVFSTSATAATFVAPALMLAYWRRATAAGSLAGMLLGALTVLSLFTAGPLVEGKNMFDPYQLLGLDPIVWGLAVSSVASVAVSLMTTPPSAELVSRLFDELPATPRSQATTSAAS